MAVPPCNALSGGAARSGVTVLLNHIVRAGRGEECQIMKMTYFPAGRGGEEGSNTGLCAVTVAQQIDKCIVAHNAGLSLCLEVTVVNFIGGQA